MEAVCAASDDPELPVRVVITLREEFLSRLAEGPGVREVLSRITVLRSPGPDALKETLANPVEVVGYAYEDDGLVEEMVGEVSGEVASLPLLQFAGQQLWERRDRKQRLLCRSAYEEMGGVAGALAHHADEILAGLTGAELRLVRAMLLRLVTPEETRRSETRDTLLEGLGEGAAMVLERLTSSRLIAVRRSEEGEGEEELELVHESLIDRWGRLRRWIDESREELALLSELEQAAELWARRGCRTEELWYGEGLRDALRSVESLANTAPHKVMRFLETSRQKDQRRTRKRRAIYTMGLVSLVLLAVAATTIAFKFARQEADVRRQQTQTRAALRQVEQQRDRATAAADHGFLLQARQALSTDPSRAAAWLRNLSPRASSADAAAVLAEARARTMAWVFTGPSAPTASVLFSPDGKLVVAAGEDMLVHVWNAATRRAAYAPLSGHTGPVWDLAFSPNGRNIASASHDGTVRIWDAVDGKPVDPPLRHDEVLFAVAYSPDGKLLATAGRRGDISLWDVSSRRRLGRPLSEHAKPIRALAFSPDGKHLASGGFDKSILLWDVKTRKKAVPPLRGSDEAVFSVAFSPDGKRLASSGRDGVVRIWDTATGKLTSSLPRRHQDVVWSVKYSPDGALLASAGQDSTVRLWNMATLRAVDPPLLGHSNWAIGLAFSPDGMSLASASADSTVRLWDQVGARNTLTSMLGGHEGSVEAVVFSPDGKLLASASTDKTVRLWDTSTRKPLEPPLRWHTSYVHSLAFSPDGGQLVSAGFDGKILLWDVVTRKLVGSLKGHKDWVLSVAFSPDGKLLASTGKDHKTLLWDAQTRRQVMQLSSVGDRENNMVTFSPNGKLLAVASDDGAIHLWDLANRRFTTPIRGHKGSVSAVAFSANGKLLASASFDQTVRLWDVVTRKALGPPLRGHTNSVECVVFTPDGKTLVSGGRDRAIRLWDVATRTAMSTLPMRHDHYVLSVSVSRDGTLLASSGPERTIRLWDFTRAVSPGHSTSKLSLAQIKQSIDKTTNLYVSPAGKVTYNKSR